MDRANQKVHPGYRNTGAHRVPRNYRRKHRRIRDPQVRNPVHPQERIDNAPILEGRHTRCACRVIQRLQVISAVQLDLVVGCVAEPVL